MPIKHSKTSDVSDAGIPDGWVKPSDWNGDHDLTGILAAIDTIGVQPNTVPYIDGDGAGATFLISAFVRSLMNSATATAFLALLSAAALNSPAFTGTPTAPTPVGSDNSGTLATTAFVQARIAALVAGSPGLLDTLNELAAALGNDPNFATTMTNALALKAPLNSPALTGTPTAPTPTAGDNSTKLATTAFIVALIAAYAPLASPALTGTPTAPTAAAGTNTTQISTTAFVQTAIGAAGIANPNRLINGGFAVYQRTQGANTASGGYLADGAYALHESGNVTGQLLTDPEAGATNGLTVTQVDATAKRIGVCLPAESLDIRDLRTVAAAVSARARLSVAGNIRWALLETTAAADGFTKNVVNNWASTTYTPGNFFTAAVSVIASGVVAPGANAWGSIAGNGTFGAAMNNAILFIWSESQLAQNATLSLNRCKLEGGSAATAFVAKSIEEILARCQRWFETFTASMSDISGALINRNTITRFPFKVTKRASVAPALSGTTTLRCSTVAVSTFDAQSVAISCLNTNNDGDDYNYSTSVTVDASIGV